jgi:hypothetical protein
MCRIFNLIPPFADSIPNEVDNSSKTPRQAQPLPREEVEDHEEKARTIAQILELQNTLEGSKICLNRVPFA